MKPGCCFGRHYNIIIIIIITSNLHLKGLDPTIWIKSEGYLSTMLLLTTSIAMAVATCNDALADNELRMRDDFLLRSPQTRKSVTWVPGTPLPRCLNIAQLAHPRVVLVLVVVPVTCSPVIHCKAHCTAR